MHSSTNDRSSRPAPSGHGAPIGLHTALVLSVVGAACKADPAMAQWVFTGAGSPPDRWCVPANWMPMQEPPSGVTITIGPGQPIDMFTCGEGPSAIGAISAQRRVRFWPTMHFAGGGTLTDPDLAMNTSSASAITGTLTVTGAGSTWTSGWLTGGTVLNTGTLRTTLLGFASHSTRTLGSASRLTNTGRLELGASLSLRDGGQLNNGGELVFLPIAVGTTSIDYNPVAPTGTIVDLGTLIVQPGANGVIRTNYINQGGITVDSGALEFFGGARSFVGSAIQIQSGGTMTVNANTTDTANFFEATAAGTGTLRLEGGTLELESLSTNFGSTLGNGLWFSHGSFPCRLGSVSINGLGSWSQGTLENLSGQPPTLSGDANLTVGPQGLLRIGTPVEAGGPGFLDRVKVQIQGDVNQQADLRLRNGAIVVIDPDADWFMPAPRGLRGEQAPTTIILRGDLFVLPSVSPFATIAQVILSIEAAGRLFVGDTRLEINNLITTPHPIRMLGDAVLDIGTLGEVRLQNQLVAVAGSPRWTGSGKLTTVGGNSLGVTVISIDDGATLTNEIDGTGPDDGFFLSHELRSGVDDPDLLGFGASFINSGRMVWLNGHVAVRNDLDEGFVNLADLFIRSTANHRLADGSMVNQARAFHEAGTLTLAQQGFFRNHALYSLTGGTIAREPGATLGQFVNLANGLLSKTQATSATISAPLDNAGRISVLEGTLTISGAIAQVTGAAGNATLSGGRWQVAQLATLATTGLTIRTLDAGASVELLGTWAQFQPTLNRGSLVLAGPARTFSGGFANRGAGTVAINTPTTFAGPVSVEGGVVSINDALGAASLSLSDGIVIENGPVTLGGPLTITGGIYDVSDRTTWTASPAVAASGGRIQGDGAFGQPGSPPVSVDCTACVLAPGNSPGVLTVNGSLAFGSGATLEIEIAGPAGPGAPDGHDQIVVTQAASVAGGLRVRLLGAYQPPPGAQFDVVSAASRVGQFNTLDLPMDPSGRPLFAVEYLPDGVRLRVATCTADVVSIGGLPPADGLLTGDDFNAFIAAFAAGDLLADVVSIGGAPPGDGLITGDDFNAFVAAFASGCP